MRHRLTILIFAVIALGVLPAASARAGGEPLVWDSYGEPITKGRTRPLSKVDGPTAEGKTLRVHGVVAEVCQAKGCWMNVGDGRTTMRVEFKDYGFFVPSNAAGKKVQLEGVVVDRTLSDAEREHLQAESESGAPIPQRLHVFVASGVKILNGGTIPEDQRQRIGGAGTSSSP
jgi:hypothetical protein